jgi:hypothetical protein
LLYTLVLALIFGLLLQFYLQNQLATKRHLLAMKKSVQVELMVKLAQKELDNKTGTVRFDRGTVKLEQEKTLVELSDGTQYRF